MKKCFGVALTALAFTAISVSSYAQGTTAAKPPAPATQKTEAPKPPAPKALNTTGTVSAVAPDSMTVKTKTESLAFVISSKTEVTAKGATHKTLALKADGKTPMLTDFVKTGYTVSVTYHEVSGAKQADTIRVTLAPVK